jgi:hypothetical protein
MRISPSHPGSNLDPDGNALVSTSDFSVLAVASSEDMRGRMGYGEVGYSQFSFRGEGPLGSTASWAVLGDLPPQAVVLLSQRELTVAYPDETNEDSSSQLYVWGRWELVLPPSASLGEDEGVVLPWTSTPGRVASRGLFAPPTDMQSQVRVANGCVWVTLAGGVTCLDFCTDLATFYQDDAGKRYTGGLDPETISDDPYGPEEPTLGCAALPYRSTALFATRTESYACVVGGDSVSLLGKKFSSPASVHVPFETQTFSDFLPTDVTILADGRVVVVGTKPSDAGEPYGTIGWCFRSSIYGTTFGDAAWEGPFYGPEPFPQFGTKISTDGRWVWVSSGVGHIWRFSDIAAEVGPSSDLEYWAGPSRAASATDLSVEPRYRSVYASASTNGIVFDQGLPVLLQVLAADQGGGSMLCCFNKTFSKVLWRRYYRQTMTGAVISPMRTPGSTAITPGRTLDPPLGAGPDDRGA